jgi:two-component system chemotaxis response regulator CheY
MQDQTDIERYKLPAMLDLAAAEGLLAALHSRLREGQRLRLDASGVELLTLPCVQIIIAAARANEGLQVDDPSSAFIAAFKEFGIEWKMNQKEFDCDINSIVADEPNREIADKLDSGAAQADKRTMTKRILTIDDSKTIRDMLMLTLSDAGFEVLQAVDGQDGLDVLGAQRVDVVITDINMPRMNGYEVIRRLRSDPAHKTTPILVLTTESDTEKVNLARDAGATGWMVKPFDPDRLIATVNKVAP